MAEEGEVERVIGAMGPKDWKVNPLERERATGRSLFPYPVPVVYAHPRPTTA